MAGRRAAWQTAAERAVVGRVARKRAAAAQAEAGKGATAAERLAAEAGAAV